MNSNFDMSKFNLITHDERLVVLIEQTDHKDLALWAIDCLNHQRHLLNDGHLKENEIVDNALHTLTLWLNDEISMWEARKYCWIVLEAARNIEKKDKVATQMLRATSHTLATCHVPTHAEGSAMYVISALQHHYKNDEQQLQIMTEERDWQIKQLLKYERKSA